MGIWLSGSVDDWLSDCVWVDSCLAGWVVSCEAGLVSHGLMMVEFVDLCLGLEPGREED